jgi:hypothetical protein
MVAYTKKQFWDDIIKRKLLGEIRGKDYGGEDWLKKVKRNEK